MEKILLSKLPARRGLAVDIAALTKRYKSRSVLRDLNLRIEGGEFVAILGRSGCGKSTLLRAVAGLETVDAGTVVFDGKARADQSGETRMMFQEARLLPWRRVWENVALGLDRDKRFSAQALLAKVGLEDRGDDWPAVLSGGQRQRVALARALIHEPRLLLLDEPLGAVDALTRIEMQQLIERLWLAQRFTALLVTHDVAEAVALADRVIILEEGQAVLDLPTRLPRPRARGSALVAALEEKVLDRLLRQPGGRAASSEIVPLSPRAKLRFAV